MAATVIGVFDTLEEANRARDRMVDEGIPESAMRTGAADGTSGTAATTTTTTSGEQEGGFFGWLKSLFGADDDEYVSHTAEAARRGSHVLAVETDNDAQTEIAERVMQAAGAIDVDQRAQRWRQEGWTGYSTTAPQLSAEEIERERQVNLEARAAAATAPTAAPVSAGAETVIPVVKEDVQVGKREIVRGGVRVVTRVVQRPVEQQVTLAEEHARIERHAVDRPATEADLVAFKEGTIEVTERAEVPVVEKTARVVEEVEVGKERTERTESIRETVRETEVDVQHTPAEGARPHAQPAQRLP